MARARRSRATTANSRNKAKPGRHVPDDDLFEATFVSSSDVDYDSEHSEYGKNRKPKPKKGKTRHLKPGRAPVLPPMSEDEYREDRAGSPELGEYLGVKQARSASRPKLSHSIVERVSEKHHTAVDKSLPTMIQIHLNPSAGGPSTINLNLTDLILRKRPFSDMGFDFALPPTPGSEATSISPAFRESDSTLIDNEPSQRANKRSKFIPDTEVSIKNARQQVKGFMDLPYEIRVRIYRQVFVSESTIHFASRNDFNRSSCLLSTCRTVYEEGRIVLYGENAFHFERSVQLRGSFFERYWNEIGYKDVRRFLDIIGPSNIALMKYVSFYFVDAAPSSTPYLDEEERRFVNDPVLHYILQLIGAHATLSKAAFTFSGRRQVLKIDYHFLKALTRIKCHEFIHVRTWGNQRSASREILQKIKRVMEIPREDADDIDLTKRKKPAVEMFHEGSTRYIVDSM